MARGEGPEIFVAKGAGQILRKPVEWVGGCDGAIRKRAIAPYGFSFLSEKLSSRVWGGVG
jgi:hypothetical protein